MNINCQKFFCAAAILGCWLMLPMVNRADGLAAVAAGYKEISRALLLKPTSPFGAKKMAWVPPAYADGHVFARSDEELICASLVAKP